MMLLFLLLWMQLSSCNSPYMLKDGTIFSFIIWVFIEGVSIDLESGFRSFWAIPDPCDDHAFSLQR